MRGVRLGEYNLKTNPDCGEGLFDDNICAPAVIDVGIDKQFVHENFNKNLHNDIALLKLQNEVEYNAFIKPICLPFKRIYNTDGLNLIVTGFGKTESGEGSNIKLRTEIEGIANDKCQEAYEKRKIAASQLCAGGVGGKDSW